MGVVRPQAMTILTAYASNILQNQPVKIGTNGTVEAAAIGDSFIGTFCGVEFTDTDGRRRVSNKWTASTSATDIVAYVTLDPTMVYEIQSNAALNVSNIGEQYDFTTISAGSTTTGLSQLMLDVASSAANASLRLIGITPGSDNNWGDTYVIAQVQISEHQNVAKIAAY
jgi:hypothetical protein